MLVAMVSGLHLTREEVCTEVKEIIASIKEIRPADVAEDAVLFGEESALQLDSLDMLDLTLALRDRFDPDGERLEAVLTGQEDLRSLATVGKIVDFIVSLAATDKAINPAVLRPEAGLDWRGSD